MICSPSFLTADFTKINEEIKSISQAKWIHFDVMDGLFVSNTTYDHDMLTKIKKVSNQFFDVHLMIVEPEKYYKKYIDNGADNITFHYEATNDALSLIKAIKENNVMAGISIKPDTNVEELDKLLPFLDLILIMSVEPGKGGQKFMENSLDKLSYLDKERKDKNFKYLLEVDGGINIDTAKLVKKVGCDVIVVGSYIFNQTDRNKMIKELENV